MLLTANFERGPDKATITVGDVGSDSPWGAIVKAANGVIAYDSGQYMYGSRGAKILTGSSNQAYLAWLLLAPWPDWYGRLYAYVLAPAVDAGIVLATAGGNPCAGIGVLKSRQLSLVDASGKGIAPMATSYPLGQWFRIEWHFVHSATAGLMELKLFLSPHSNTPTETLTMAAQNTRGPADQLRFGMNALGGISNLGPWWLDAIVADQQGYPGPFPLGAHSHFGGPDGGGGTY